MGWRHCGPEWHSIRWGIGRIRKIQMGRSLYLSRFYSSSKSMHQIRQMHGTGAVLVSSHYLPWFSLTERSSILLSGPRLRCKMKEVPGGISQFAGKTGHTTSGVHLWTLWARGSICSPFFVTSCTVKNVLKGNILRNSFLIVIFTLVVFRTNNFLSDVFRQN